MAFSRQYNQKPIVDRPQVERTQAWESNNIGSEIKVKANGDTETRLNTFQNWTKAVDPTGPINFHGVEIGAAQIPDLIRAGVISQVQVDAIRKEQLKGQQALPFDQTPSDQKEGEDVAEQEQADSAEAEVQKSIAEHNATVDSVYDTNAPEAVTALIEDFVAEGKINETAVLPAETVDKMYASYSALYERTTADYGVDAKLTAQLTTPEEQATLRQAVIFQNEGAMLRIAASLRDRMYQPETQAKLVKFAHAGGFKTQAGPSGQSLIQLADGWVPLIDAIVDRRIVLTR